MACKTMGEIKYKKDKYYPQMKQTDIDYLELVPDHEQYPAARLELYEHCAMYQRSSSQMVEAMNNANKQMRVRSGVDLVNATLLLLQMESERYERQRTYAMNCETRLTPKGNYLRSAVWKQMKEFDDDFTVVVQEEESQYNCCVRGKKTGKYEIDIVSEPCQYGCYEHSCSCGTPEKDGVPCVHVMALVKSKVLPFLTPTNVMPYYWTTKMWRVQFDENGGVNSAPITREYLTVKYEPDESLRYMPDFVAKRKRGRPKKNKRIKSALELALLSKKKKKEKKRRPREEDLLGPDDVEFGFNAVGMFAPINGEEWKDGEEGFI